MRQYNLSDGHPYIIASGHPGKRLLSIPLKSTKTVILRRDLEDRQELYVSASRIVGEISLN